MSNIRDFKPNDMEQIMAIWYDVTVHDQSFIPQSFWTKMRDVVRERYLPGSRTWVFVDDSDNVLAFVSLIDDLIGALFVSREHQSNGIGRALVEYVAAWQSPLYVDVYAKNKDARRFYRRCGFVRVGDFVQDETGEKVIKKEFT